MTTLSKFLVSFGLWLLQTRFKWVFGLLTLLTGPLAATGLVQFERVAFQESLSGSGITRIVQDPMGFLWFGTTDGLNRYDGYTLEAFRHDPDTPTSLPGNFVRSLLVDPQGQLWVGTLSGQLARFEPISRTFVTFSDLFEREGLADCGAILDIEFDPEGRVWMATEKAGLLWMSQDGKRLKSVILAGSIHALFLDTQQRLWIAGKDALHFLNKNQTLVESHPWPMPVISDRLDHMALTMGPDDLLWVGTPSGLFSFNRETRAFSALPPPLHHAFAGRSVKCLLLDHHDHLWIGTPDRGVMRYKPEEDTLEPFAPRQGDPNSLSDTFVLSLMEDRAGLVWIGTEIGINKYRRSEEQFPLFRHLVNDEATIRHDFVRTFYQDRQDRIWVGHKAGLDLLDQELRVVDTFTFSDDGEGPVTPVAIVDILQGQDDHLWLGSDLGLLSFSPERGILQRFLPDPDTPDSISSNEAIRLFLDQENQLWIGTNGQGLNRLNADEQTFTRFLFDKDNPDSLSHNYVRAIVGDHLGGIWIGTLGGLNLIRPGQPGFVRYKNQRGNPQSLSHDMVQCILESKPGELWVGTYGGGINRFLFDDQHRILSIDHYTERQGLKNNSVYGICMDQQGMLWLSTNQGLSRFDPEHEQFRNFDVSDGLQSNEFNSGAFFQAPDGRMFFGGIDGFNAFYGNQVHEPNTMPPIVLTDFKKFDESVRLDQPLNQIQSIRLGPSDKVISFRFATLDYRAPNKNRFRYKLEGLGDDWIDLDTKHDITLTSLDPKQYTLRIIGANSQGQWNHEGLAIDLTVVPPWYRTWWAYLLFGLLGLMAIAFYLRIKAQAHEAQLARKELELARQRLASEHLEESNRQLQVIDKMKDQILANTSHELKTPLNGMIGLAESMLDGGNGLATDQQESLKMIVSSGVRLTNLVNDILDYSKVISDRMELNQRSLFLHEWINLVEKLSKPLIDPQRLAFINEVPDSLPPVAADVNRIQQILHNLVGNAIKFTKRGSIRIWAEINDDYLWTHIADTGIGIPEDQFEKIFRSFEQVDASSTRNYGGTGLGLSITKELVERHGGDIEV